MANWVTAFGGGRITPVMLEDLHEKKGEISFYCLTGDSSSILRVAAAFAATKQKFLDTDYALVSTDLVFETGIEIRRCPGNTADPVVNQWHVEVIPETADELLCLVKLMVDFNRPGKAKRHDIVQFIVESIKGGSLDPQKLAISDAANLRELIFRVK